MRRLSDLTGETHANDPRILGLTADSRKVMPGWLFVAIPGTKADGRAFIADALAKGASAVLAPDGTSLPPGNAVLVTDPNPRRRFALMAAAFHGDQPETMVAVTGTNGKTSVANFFRQIAKRLGLSSAAIGTLGISADNWPNTGGLTTPDPADLHEALAELAKLGVTHACMEASSHGLSQYRLDGVKLKAAAFTNLTRDHLDYHGTMEEYAQAKLRLFSELLPSGASAVINADSDVAPRIEAIAAQRGLATITFGTKGTDLKLHSAKPLPHGQVLDMDMLGRRITVRLPLAGTFQASNALAALGLAIACGLDPDRAAQALEHLDGVPGRLQKVAERANGGAIYVDYAHTPDALETVLHALRPHTEGKLVVVFGCGGDRDPGKRPQMGAIATRLADMAVVTDDNPRNEDPAAIRRAILDSAPGAVEIASRADAIRFGVAALQKGDVLVIAGKGHEIGQIVGSKVLPFDDSQEASSAVTQIDAATQVHGGRP